MPSLDHSFFIKSLMRYTLKLGVLRSGFLRPITDCRSQKAVSANPITDTDLFKPIFLSCRIIYSDDPISICRHLFRAWILFLNGGNSSLRWLLWEDFLIWGVDGGTFRHYNRAVVAEKLTHSTRLISHRSPLPIHLFTTNTTFIHDFDSKSKHCYWKCFVIVIIFL